VIWISCPMTDGDRIGARRAAADPTPPSPQENLRFADVPEEAYDRYYRVFSNSVLWSLQHYLWDISSEPNINSGIYDAWYNGYVTANQLVADAVVDAIGQPAARPMVFFQDYHLYLVAGQVRERLPGALLQHFIHIPWPAPRYWALLPEEFRTPILKSLCHNHIVGFQTHRDSHNFLYCCEYLLPGCRVNYRKGTVRFEGGTTYARAYPISIDVNAVRATAASPEAESYLRTLILLRGSQQTIVRVDRLEPTKNLLRGFKAFDMLLGRYPQLAGKVRFWTFLVPSRMELANYRQYADQVFELIGQINARHGNDAWRPIEVFYENNYVQAVAAMTQYDVLMVNSVLDGMNLVAKEGVSVNQRDGVLILSETAGAFEELGRDALPVAATDVEGMVRALHYALTMGRRERRRRASRLRRVVEQAGLSKWVGSQMEDMHVLASGGRLSPQHSRPVSAPAPRAR
ncbi:MAG: trehalose-6-phosphate synthase, partial [Chloroflexota bacterium]